MFSKPFLVAALAVACVTAAGAGAYIAVRQNHDVEPASAANQSADTTNPAKPANPAVPETEAVIPPPLAMPLEQPRPMAQAPAPRETVQAESRTTRTRNAGSAGSSVRPSEASTAARPTAAGASSPAGATSGPIAPAEPSTAGRAEATTAASLPPESARYEPPPAPPAPVFDELVVPSSAVMGLQIQTALSSEHARIEDRVEARVTRDISVDGKTAIPAGTRAVGSVTLVEKGGKVKERARLGVRFHTLVLADGTELPIRTETVMREGESPTGDSSRKIGGAAAGGAILGAIIGGKKGAIIGGATGAAGGTAAVMAGDRSAATLPVGAVLTVRLSSPITVAVERK